MFRRLFGRTNLSAKELGRIVGPLAESCRIKSVWLFGSRANGAARNDADYDFLIDVEDDYASMTASGSQTAWRRP